jgi:hypothetical protein
MGSVSPGMFVAQAIALGSRLLAELLLNKREIFGATV